jgi:CheY-like chemotaxis protein
MAQRIVLVHWNAAEAEERAEKLRVLGYQLTYFSSDPGPAALRAVKERPPDAFVIDLGRLPSHGRAIAAAIRQQKATRQVPLVFVAGAAEKVAVVREQLPDAVYTSWPRIASALKKAIAKPVAAPIVPKTMDAYSTTPLPKKLGIKDGLVISLIDAPEGFEETLGDATARATLRRGSNGKADLILWFVESAAALTKGLPTIERMMKEGGGVWVAWPKKSSGLKTDLGEQLIRETCISKGLVDYKVCAIDDTWSGLKFARKK